VAVPLCRGAWPGAVHGVAGAPRPLPTAGWGWRRCLSLWPLRSGLVRAHPRCRKRCDARSVDRTVGPVASSAGRLVRSRRSNLKVPLSVDCDCGAGSWTAAGPRLGGLPEPPSDCDVCACAIDPNRAGERASCAVRPLPTTFANGCAYHAPSDNCLFCMWPRLHGEGGLGSVATAGLRINNLAWASPAAALVEMLVPAASPTS
jgi:hypothetical protein